jgi:amidohydrolase
VLLVFQPAEELPPGGAAAMLADGVLTDPPVDRAFGLHLWTAAPTGTILVGGGTLWAATAVFRVRLVGRGGHAALPGETLDPVVAAGRLVVALNELVAPGTRALLAVTTVHAGETFNVVPETAELSGTLRAFDRAVLADLATRLTVTASEVAAATGVRAEVEYREGYPPLVNDPALAELVRAACAEVVGAEAVGTAVPSFAGEDFARFAQAVPACFFQVGTANAAADSTWPHHHPRFALDEDALAIGVAALAAVAERALSQDGT